MVQPLTEVHKLEVVVVHILGPMYSMLVDTLVVHKLFVHCLVVQLMVELCSMIRVEVRLVVHTSVLVVDRKLDFAEIWAIVFQFCHKIGLAMVAD